MNDKSNYSYINMGMMKKFFTKALMGAIALMGAMNFTACSDKESLADENPAGGTANQEVPVQFVFNISTNAAKGQTRMSADNVQANGDNFRGINEARILTYHNEQAGTHVTTASTATRMFNLSHIAGDGELSKENSTRVIEISLPNGTNSMMFYGRAPKTEDNGAQGLINTYFKEDNSDNSSKVMLMPRVSQYELDANGNETAVETEKYKHWRETRLVLATVLNRVVENGLHVETEGSQRDLRGRVWWPANVQNYSLEGPLYQTADGTAVALTADNSNIDEVGEGNTDFTITYNGVSTGYVYRAATKKLTTNVDTYDFNLVTIEWSEYGQKQLSPNAATAHLPANYEMTPLEEILGNVYNSFTVMKDGELRAGSASAINRMMEDLWTVTNMVYTASPTQLQEAVAQHLARRIYTRFSTYFEADVNTETGVVQNCSLKTPKELVVAVARYAGLDPEDDFTESFRNSESTENINNFPKNEDLQMPPGSTQLTFENGQFKYNEMLAAHGLGMDEVSPLKYLWPAELLYYGNAPLRTSEKTVAPLNFPQTTAAWANASTWDNSVWTDNTVTPTTRSVAMQYNINYATALLETSIYYDSNELYDNNAELNNGAPANILLVSEENNGNKKFELTGIVVGGQTNEVDWHFLPKTTGSRTYLVYDAAIVKGSGANVGTYGAYIPGYTAEKTGSRANYTMLFDNWNEAQKDKSQDKVYVALEFRNCSGRDFWGVDNLVRDGGYFYLIGALDPNEVVIDGERKTLSIGNVADLAEGIAWPSDDTQALPPFDSNGKTLKQRRVFIQGYKTAARFGIGKNSLKKAYITVPDLRSANISLGLSVNLEWKKGLEFDTELGK